MESTYVHEKLNPIFFDENNNVRDNIKDKLLIIAKKAFEDLEINTPIEDITFTGSLANYTYTKESDVDLHILIDFDKVNKDKLLVKRALDCNKFVWNLRHEITFAGHEVEVYFQDISEKHTSTGVYSLLKNKWLVEPKQLSDVEVDEHIVKKKYEEYKNHILSLQREANKPITKNYAEKILNNAKRYFKKLKADRKEGLEKEGELSEKNLIFKQLRQNGFIDMLTDLINIVYDKSLTESYLVGMKTGLPLKTKMKPQMKKLFKTLTKKTFFKMTPGTKKRHQHPVGRTGMDRKNAQFVPDVHKADMGTFSKLDNLRKGQTGKFVLSPSELKMVKDRFNISHIMPGEVKKLGNTGIRVYLDTAVNRYIMER
jgi:hypothetical protein